MSVFSRVGINNSNMREVRVGDYVRCIDDHLSMMTYGNMYLVDSLGVSHNESNDVVYFVINDAGMYYGYYFYRFEFDINYIRRLKLDKLESLGCLSSVDTF